MRLFGHEFHLKQLFKNTQARVKLSLYMSLAINLSYSAFKLLTGVFYGSAFPSAVAIYYAVLAFMRFSLLFFLQKNKAGKDIVAEYKKYRTCGCLLFALNLTLTGTFAGTVLSENSYSGSNLIMMGAIAYTLYITGFAVYSVIKFRKLNSPVMSAAKKINLVTALVALLSLENNILNRYFENNLYRHAITAISGTFVCAFIVGLSVYMVIRANIVLIKENCDKKRKL